MKIQRRLVTIITFIFALMLSGIAVVAQEAQQEKKPQNIEREVIVDRNGIVISAHGPAGHPPLPPDVLAPRPGEAFTFNFVSSEMSFDHKVVKGAPHSAEAVTETIQTLSDGNHIVRKTTASVYRDSEGRTRRNQALGTIGPFAAAGDPPQTFFINDPVTGVNYILDPRSRTARKLVLSRFEGKADGKVFHAPVPAPDSAGNRVMIFENFDPPPGPERAAKPAPKPQTESLGKQVIEGIEAEGTRTTMTIPAGEIGNERPIQIVSEHWYSPELQTVVMSKHNDPLIGETTYRLTNINRSEPARSLFDVPADYKVKEAPPFAPEFRMRVRKPGDDK